MGLLSWLFGTGGRKPSKAQGRRQHRNKGRRDAVNRQLRAAGINPDMAFCTECGQWYNVRNHAAVNLHAH